MGNKAIVTIVYTNGIGGQDVEIKEFKTDKAAMTEAKAELRWENTVKVFVEKRDGSVVKVEG